MQFDFEKSYVSDIFSWSNAVMDPDVLLTKFQDNDWDSEVAYSIFSQFDLIIQDIRSVREGMSRGPVGGLADNQSSELSFDDHIWETDTDGRIWSALDLGINHQDLSKKQKLTKSLKSEVEMLQKLHRCRQFVIESFHTFNKRKIGKASSQKNLFKEGQKLDEMVAKYHAMLQKEMALRRLILQKLRRPYKGLDKTHKLLLEAVITKLRALLASVLDRRETQQTRKNCNENNVHMQCLEFTVAETNVGCANLKTDGVTMDATTGAQVSSREELIPVRKY